jgi:hypothetical protein
MSMVVFCGAMAVGLVFVTGIVASRNDRKDFQCLGVGDRFLERGVPLDTNAIRSWVEANPGAARRYAFPILFPLDFLFMLSLGVFLGAGSVLTAETIEPLQRFALVGAAIPATYVASAA